eukprot:bmy_14370T0
MEPGKGRKEDWGPEGDYEREKAALEVGMVMLCWEKRIKAFQKSLEVLKKKNNGVDHMVHGKTDTRFPNVIRTYLVQYEYWLICVDRRCRSGMQQEEKSKERDEDLLNKNIIILALLSVYNNMFFSISNKDIRVSTKSENRGEYTMRQGQDYRKTTVQVGQEWESSQAAVLYIVPCRDAKSLKDLPKKFPLFFPHAIAQSRIAANAKTNVSVIDGNVKLIYLSLERLFQAGRLLAPTFSGLVHSITSSEERLKRRWTSLTKSENILSATLYFYIGELINISLSCPMSQGCSHHTQRKHIQIDLSTWILKSTRNQSQLLGHLSVDGAKLHRDFVSWLSKDITQLLRKAKENEEFLIGFNITSKGYQLPKKITPFPEPYILSVVSSLQGHRNFPTGAVPKLDSHIRAALSTERRKKRSTGVLLPLQNNELPGAEYQYKEDGVWEERKPYKTLQTQPPEKSKNKKKQRKGPHQKSQMLQFDEQTLKKARRKQWIEPRNCARRYLKVDFADIGWSEWIVSRKSFDAYYCSGTCQFPMPKCIFSYLVTCESVPVHNKQAPNGFLNTFQNEKEFPLRVIDSPHYLINQN